MIPGPPKGSQLLSDTHVLIVPVREVLANIY